MCCWYQSVIKKESEDMLCLDLVLCSYTTFNEFHLDLCPNVEEVKWV